MRFSTYIPENAIIFPHMQSNLFPLIYTKKKMSTRKFNSYFYQIFASISCWLFLFLQQHFTNTNLYITFWSIYSASRKYNAKFKTTIFCKKLEEKPKKKILYKIKQIQKKERAIFRTIYRNKCRQFFCFFF